MRARIRAGDLVDSAAVRRLTPEERSALADVLNSESNPMTYAYDRLTGFAQLADFYPSDSDEEPPTLADLGLTEVRAGRDGRTVWESDAAQHRLAEHVARQAAIIRAECVRECLRDAYADARSVGALEPSPEALAVAHEVAQDRADGILAALAA